MRTIRILTALILTAALLYVVRLNSRGHTEHLSANANGFRLSTTTVPKIIEGETDTLALRVESPQVAGTNVWLRTTRAPGVDKADKASYDRSAMHLDSAQNAYTIPVKAGLRGGDFYYYFELTDTSGATLATLSDEGKPIRLRFIGHLPPAILIGHISFIFATVFCIIMAVLHAVAFFVSAAPVRPVIKYLFFATLFCFIGGYPFGIPMNYYAFNGFWEGVPFGTDATDNKTQLLFVFLLYTTLAGAGTLGRGRFLRDIYQSPGLARLGLLAGAVMLFVYLIPHSIQFSANFTYTFCYAWIGLIAALYLVGWMNSGERREVTS